MPVNVYDATGRTTGSECSSTYEGRHLTFEESVLVHPARDSGLVLKGDPVVVGTNAQGAGRNIVGVAFKSAAAATDLIAIDTEGIWFLTVLALDAAGNASAVRVGDEIFINLTTAVLSKDSNKATSQRFGYALGSIADRTDAVIAVKVHWNPDDAEEIVGLAAGQYVSAVVGKIFRHYRYTSSAPSGDARGEYLRLHLTGGGSGEASRVVTVLDAVAGGGIHGQHASLMIGANGAVTGLGAAHRQTLYLPNRALAAGGGYYASMAEIFLDGNDADISPVTRHAVLQILVDGGNAAAQNRVKNAIAFDQTKGADGSGNMIYTHAHAEGNAAGSIRCLVNGAVKYLKFWDAE